MQLNSIQVAGLRALVDAVEGNPDQSASLSPSLRVAFHLGKAYGKAELAQEILQEAQDRQGGQLRGE